MASDPGRTEKASPKKRQDEREKGNIFQSRDVTSTLSLLALVVLFKLAGGSLWSGLARVVEDGYGTLGVTEQITVTNAASLLGGFAISALLLILPIGGAAMALGVVLDGVQTRFMFAKALLKPKLSRLNPAAGLKNMFSMRSLVELIKSILKVTVIGVILYQDVSSRLLQVQKMPLVSLQSSIAWTGDAVFSIVIRILMFMVFFAAADYMYQWWEYEQRIRMTKQEVKEEMKRMEGDPNIKARIRDVQRKMAMMRMMQKVPLADVVIRNPTHFAVALQYDPKKDRAPVVVAKGADQVALNIVRIAEENGVYVTENRPLARGLFEAVELDSPIPEEFYKPVADVIAFVYKLRKKAAR
jgi:flagellar biosynthetic protein FlhB